MTERPVAAPFPQRQQYVTISCLVGGVRDMNLKTARAWAVLALACAPVWQAGAADPRYAHLIDAVCISTAVEQQRMATNMSVLRASELPREQAANLPAERAWMFADNGLAVMVGYRARVADGNSVRECVLAFQGGGHAAVMHAIETSYRLRRMLDETQGTQRLTAYAGDLIGLPDAVVTIQSTRGQPGIHTVTVTQGMRLPR
jgi:hypothetical protein